MWPAYFIVTHEQITAAVKDWLNLYLRGNKIWLRRGEYLPKPDIHLLNPDSKEALANIIFFQDDS